MTFDGELMALCGKCGLPILVRLSILAQHGREQTEPICPTCRELSFSSHEQMGWGMTHDIEAVRKVNL